MLEAAEPSAPEASDDEAPEEVGFGASKDKAIEERKKIKGTIKEIKAGKKLKQMKLQKRNQAQKVIKIIFYVLIFLFLIYFKNIQLNDP